MSRVRTPAISADAGTIVFGPIKGQKLGRAGLFVKQPSEVLTQAAAQQGLLAFSMAAQAVPNWRDRLPVGVIARNGSLRLQAIRPNLLRELQALYAETVTAKNAPGLPGDKAGSSTDPQQPSLTGPDLGPNLLGAYRLLDSAGAWIERLQAEFAEMLASIGKASEWSFLKESQWADFDAYAGGEGWVADGWRWTYPARHQRRRVGTLSLVVDIGKPGRAASALGFPCVLVMWSSEAHDWLPALDSAKGFWPPNPETTRLVADRGAVARRDSR